MENTSKHIELHTELFTYDKHCDIVATWEDGHGKSSFVVPSDLGLIVTHDEKPVAAMWIYTTNSPIAFLDGLISDPNADRHVRSAAVDHILIEALALLKREGYMLALGTPTLQKLKRRAEAIGFRVWDKQYTLMAKVLNHGIC